jgi:hypothetical protein
MTTLYNKTYSGIVEALTLDEAAVRIRKTRQWFDENYDGPRVRLGRCVSVSSKHLDAWLDERAGVSPMPHQESVSTGDQVSVD